MKKNLMKFLMAAAVLSIMLTGCSQTENAPAQTTAPTAAAESSYDSETVNTQSQEVLYVTFDDKTFTMNMEDNDTAKAIIKHVGTADWNLPIYNFDNYENWELFQYYDIPSRYEIPDGSATVTSEKGGEVYYSHPNRIILFYHDAEIEGEYTKIGTIEYTDEFVKAVEENPTVPGWGNKVVTVSPD